MPYSSTSDLPDSVRNNIPAHAQKIFFEAFNSAYGEYGHEEVRAFKVAWSAVKKEYEKKGGKWVKKARRKAS